MKPFTTDRNTRVGLHWYKMASTLGRALHLLALLCLYQESTLALIPRANVRISGHVNIKPQNTSSIAAPGSSSNFPYLDYVVNNVTHRYLLYDLVIEIVARNDKGPQFPPDEASRITAILAVWAAAQCVKFGENTPVDQRTVGTSADRILIALTKSRLHTGSRDLVWRDVQGFAAGLHEYIADTHYLPSAIRIWDITSSRTSTNWIGFGALGWRRPPRPGGIDGTNNDMHNTTSDKNSQAGEPSQMAQLEVS